MVEASREGREVIDGAVCKPVSSDHTNGTVAEKRE
jgi:hypothetical protein